MLPVTPRGNLVYIPDGEVLEGYFHDRSELAVIQGPIGCLSAETEYLSPTGWTRMDAYDGGEIMVWSPDGASRFERPAGYIDRPCSKMWSFRSEHALSMVLSDEHRVPLIGRDGSLRVRLASEVAVAPGRYTVPTTFSVEGEVVDEARLRLMVAISADGCFPKRGNQVVITVRKERKKRRLRQLLLAAGVPAWEHQHSTRPTERTFALPRLDWMSKRLDLWRLSSASLEVVIDECRHWDGLHAGDLRYYSTDRDNAEMIQFAAHATGRRATISIHQDARAKDWKPLYIVHIARAGSPKARVGMRADSVTIKRVPAPGGRKYCFTTSTGFFLARHDGRIFVTGNSGTSSCSCHKIWKFACEQAADFDKVRRTRWIVTRDTYKDLRDTTIKTWLEWFPEDQWGPMIRGEPSFHHLKRPHPSGDGTTVDCEVIFLAVPDPDIAERVLASYEITGFFRNEGQFCEKEVIDELLSRCARYPSMKNGPGATWHGGFIDLNAPSEGHWIPYMRGDVPLPAEWPDEVKQAYRIPLREDGTPRWKFFVQPAGLIEARVDGKIVYQPNPKAENQRHLRKTYMEQVAGKSKEWIDQRIMNKVSLRKDGKPVYPTFSEVDHINARDLDPVPGIPIIVGLDFGRDPAAAFMQNVNGQWTLLSELIGDNESALLFAPRVKRHLLQRYPGYSAEFWGDPRGGDGTQATETTAFDVFLVNGMRVLPATTDNNPELRRSAVERALERRNGFKVNPSCIVAKTGFAGGYHYPKIKGAPGMFAPRPRKNRFSHIVESVENALLGGGEGFAVVRGGAAMPKAPSKIHRHEVKFRRFA